MPFLQQRGYEFKRCGNEFHMKGHDSFVVSKNLWCWNSRNMGGNIVGFLTKVEKMNVVDAILMLCNENTLPLECANHKFEHPVNKEKNIILPVSNENSRHVFAYLTKTRGINNEIVTALINQGKIYESIDYFAKVKTNDNQYENAKLIGGDIFERLQYHNIIANVEEPQSDIMLGFDHNNKLRYVGVSSLDDETIIPYLQNGYLKDIKPSFNCVFCGFDEHGNVKYASMRGISNNSTFRQDAIGSDKKHGFLMSGTTDRVYVLEAPIDAMSHASLFKLCDLDWKKDSRLSLGGVSELALDNFLEQRPNIKKITFCLDNDRTGKNNVYGVYNQQNGEQELRSLLKKYTEKGYDTDVSFPTTKDYNMDLMTYNQGQEEKDEEDNDEI